jgi:hypothetical protein
MLTETEVARGPEVPEDIEEVEYPPEVVARWDAKFEAIKLKLATGELVPKTLEELAAKLGFDKVYTTNDEIVFAEPSYMSLLGVRTLEGFSVMLDNTGYRFVANATLAM